MARRPDVSEFDKPLTRHQLANLERRLAPLIASMMYSKLIALAIRR